MVQELTNIDGQFHDVVPERSGYFGPRELCGGDDGEEPWHSSDTNFMLVVIIKML